MKPTRIVIADDHAVVRQGLRTIFDEQDDMEVMAEAEDGMEALKTVRKFQPDVILLDIAMPALSGLEAIGPMKEAVPELKVIVVSMHSNESYVHQVLEAGALGYVLKASPSADILQAVRSVRRGEYFLSSRIHANVIDSFLKAKRAQPVVRGYDLLSEREQQVFRLVVEGRSTKEIADILNLSPKTVEKHRTSITSKLGVHGRLELLKYAIKIGVVNPELWED